MTVVNVKIFLFEKTNTGRVLKKITLLDELSQQSARSIFLHDRGFQPLPAGRKGYCVFSYSKPYMDTIVKYILNREAHHRKKSFLEEYRKMPVKFEAEYDEKYTFCIPSVW